MPRKIKRIFFLRYENSSRFAQWHDFQFIAELRARDVVIKVFEFPKAGKPENGSTAVLAEELRAAQDGDIILSCLFDVEHSVFGLFDVIAKTNLPTVLICFDNLQVWYKHRKSADQFDFVWLTSPDDDNQFSKRSAHSIYLPYAANPDNMPRSKAVCAASKHHGITFFGTPYGARKVYLNALTQSDFPLNCFGNGYTAQNSWRSRKQYGKQLAQSAMLLRSASGRKLLAGSIAEKLRKTPQLRTTFDPLPTDALYPTLAASSLVLNSSIVWQTHQLKQPLHKSHLRIFETASAGGLQLIEHTDVIEEFFEPQREVVTFSSVEELLENARKFTDPKMYTQVCEMKLNAYDRVAADHTWSLRFQMLEALF